MKPSFFSEIPLQEWDGTCLLSPPPPKKNYERTIDMHTSNSTSEKTQIFSKKKSPATFITWHMTVNLTNT